MAARVCPGASRNPAPAALAASAASLVNPLPAVVPVNVSVAFVVAVALIRLP